ncbi:Hypothetical protein ERS075552_02435 [Mycobacteroides abscessus]|nr:Hypothetical protein ERS075552_02435 [Mycobacteroides abscessus]
MAPEPAITTAGLSGNWAAWAPGYTDGTFRRRCLRAPSTVLDRVSSLIRDPASTQCERISCEPGGATERFPCVTDEQSGAAASADARPSTSLIARISIDWWATIIAGVIALLAVANVLPKIPW